MSAGEEHFEKLEAYIDGMLDADGQAEVERLLASNPQLRAMIDDLKRGRQMLIALPRISAPADVAETFQGHLERAALLGDSDSGEVASPLRIHRWPQFMSIAAMLLLALGLFAVIYQILPKNGGKSSVAIKNSATQPHNTDTLLADGAPGGLRDVEKNGEMAGKYAGAKGVGDAGGGGGAGGFGGISDRKSNAGDGQVNKAGSPLAAAKPGSGDDFASGGGGASRMLKGGQLPAGVVDNRAPITADELRHVQQLERANFRYGNTGNTRDATGAGNDGVAAQDEPAVMVVNAKNPKLAADDVEDYLTRNEVPFVSVPEGLNRLGSITLGYSNNEPQNQAAQLQANSAALDSSKQDASAYDSRARSDSTMRRKAEGNSAVGQNSNPDNNGPGNNGLGNNSASNPSGPNDAGYSRGGAQQRSANVAGNGTSTNGGLDNYDQKRAPSPEAGQRGYANNSALAPQSQASLQGQSQTRPAQQPESLYVNVGNRAGNYINSSNGYGVTGTYRAMLTGRQLKELNERISRRGDQWAETRGEAMSEVRQRAELGTSAAGAASNSLSLEKIEADKSNVGPPRETVEAKRQAKSSLAEASPPRRPLEAPAGSEKESFGAQSPATNPTNSPSNDHLSLAQAAPRSETARTAPATPPGDVPPPAPFAADHEQVKKTESAKDGAETGGRGFASSRPSFGRLDETLEKQLQMAPQGGAAADADEPREVLIVVNDQPIDLPTVLPASQPSVGPTTAPAAPTTAPSGPPVGQQPSK